MSGSIRSLAALLCLLVGLAPALPASAEGSGGQKRIALVVGNAAYEAGALATPANDAGLVAQTLQAAGFDVVGARDLDEDALRRALRDFADKAAASGPDTVAFVYLAGYGLQLAGENYFVPVDAKIAAAADVPVRALRLSDYTRQLAALPLAARFVVLDGARTAPFARTGDPLAGGLALAEAEPGSLVAFNASPGTVGPDERGPYGAYATALVEMIREGGLTPAQLFDRVRLRVDETTKGAEVPWHASRIEASFAFFERAADAPPIGRPEEVAALRARPLQEIGARDAYAVCLQRDTIDGYQEFVQAYPRDAMAKRVRALIAARREVVTWRRTWIADSREAYWSYLDRYPRGPHAWDARRRLRQLSAALEPPPRFAAIGYDVPPPPPEEIVYVERPALYLDDPVYAFAPPPPPPPVFLPPPPAYIVELAPPPPPPVTYALPTPAFVPVPTYVSAPASVAPPPNNVIYQNIHNVTVINTINERNAAYARDPEAGPALSPGLAVGAGAVAGAALGAAAARVALPPAVAQKAVLRGPNPGPNPNVGPGLYGAPQGSRPGPGGPGLVQPSPQQAGRPGFVAPGQPAAPVGLTGRTPGQPLPGNQGQPLPQQPGQPGFAPAGHPGPQQAERPGTGAPRPVVPPTANRPGQALPGADGQPLPPQQATRPDTRPSVGAPGKAGPAVDPQAATRDPSAPRPDGRGGADSSGAAFAGRPQPGQPGQRALQADRPGTPLPNGLPGKPAPTAATPPAGLARDTAPPTPPQASRPGPGPAAATGGRPQLGQPLPDPLAAQRAGHPGNGPDAGPPRPDALAAQRQEQIQAQQAQAAQQRQQQMQAQQAMQKQQADQAAAQRQQQQAQAAAQRQQMMQQQQAQAAAQRQQQAAQRQQMMQQQQAQQAAQRQQMMQAQQAQAAQQRQQMMQQQQAQAAQRQQMQQQMMMQRQQAPRPGPPGGGHGCPPGMPCR